MTRPSHPPSSSRTRLFRPLAHPADCPGLVFPSFVQTREEMVCNGILPIDQLREHTLPMRLLCQRIPRAKIVDVYGLKLPTPGPGQNANRQPTVAELLDAFCHMRGFMASTHAGPDHPRAARVLLKDYCEGKIAYCHPPPLGWAAPPAQPAKGAPHAPAASRVTLEDNVLLPAVDRKSVV